MMFSKSFIAAAALCLGLVLHADAHAAIAPALGVQGAPVRSDAQRPTNARPCGRVDITQNLDTSAAAPVDANGQFTATITNFNRGVDGSTQVTAKVDPSGTGDSFVDVTVLKNGERNPRTTGSVQLSVQLPAGTTCTGGTTGSKCLVSFVTAGRFGNCVVVDQGAAAAGANSTSTDAATGTETEAAGDVATAIETSAGAASTASATGNTGDASNAEGQGTVLDRLRNTIEKQRQQQAAGTRRARIARLAAEHLG